MQLLEWLPDNNFNNNKKRQMLKLTSITYLGFVSHLAENHLYELSSSDQINIWSHFPVLFQYRILFIGVYI